MTWRGFLTESKSYMAYGVPGQWGTPRLEFWRQFPKAATRFYIETARYELRRRWDLWRMQ